MTIRFVPLGHVPDRTVRRNEAINARKGYPSLGDSPPVPLAVVGGGPSVAGHVETLKAWPGEVWAINGAWRWCRAQGIEAAFFSIDPHRIVAEHAKGAGRAIISLWCDPRVYGAVRGPVEAIPTDLPCGPTSACTAPMVAARRGHPSVTLFGCESSFADRTHVYQGAERPSRVLVACGGREFLTSPQLLMQAMDLCETALGVPGFIRVAGDGLLPALIANDGRHEVVKVTRDIMESLSK